MILSAIRKLAVPLYLLACLLLGGSNQGIWSNTILQIGAVALIGAAAAFPSKSPAGPPFWLLLLIVATLVLVLLQLVPLPPDLWTILPGRDVVSDGYRALQQPLPWLSLSMTPDKTLETLFFSLPAIGIVVAVLYLDVDARWCAGALLVGTLGSVLLGALQVTAGSSWHLYEITNTGAVGFFANRNFMGSLLVVSVPFAAALATSLSRRSAKAKWPSLLLGGGLIVLLLVGLALNQSLAATVLLIPVALASLALLPGKFDWKRIGLGAAALLALGGFAFIMGSSVPLELTGEDATSYETRRDIWSQTLTIINASFPAGTGLGSFSAVYALYENPAEVDRFYVNAAHNDYLQWTLELGAAGVLLALAFLAWWIVQAYRIWTSPTEDVFARAAVIASGALLAHSFVDYPLRTAALSAILAYCLGTMAKRRTGGVRFEHPNIRSPRHVRIA